MDNPGTSRNPSFSLASSTAMPGPFSSTVKPDFTRCSSRSEGWVEGATHHSAGTFLSFASRMIAWMVASTCSGESLVFMMLLKNGVGMSTIDLVIPGGSFTDIRPILLSSGTQASRFASMMLIISVDENSLILSIRYPRYDYPRCKRNCVASGFFIIIHIG